LTENRLPPAIVIAGPTASGKSGLALALAEEFNGVVINADAMQVYRELRILTARPGAEAEARAPHRLYGVLPAADPCSAGRWRDMAAAACWAAWAEDRRPILVGGTGLYLRALVSGLSPVPPIPEEVRAATRALFASLGNDAFHQRLAERDPEMAARLDPGNSQRLMRAWEVVTATGRSLAAWQADPPIDPLPASLFTLLVMPPRQSLYAACEQRFAAMVKQGAVDEVSNLLSLALDPSLPVMKALGVAELARHLEGRLDLRAAVSHAQQATRQYAKRQTTWFRHQLIADHVISTQFSESLLPGIFAIIRHFLLTKE
jgi:tRNA dimethylallyltransferase